MDKLVLKNGMVLIGKVKELKRELKQLPASETLNNYIRKNLN